MSAEGQACIFVAVDHCLMECVGVHAARTGNRFEAPEPIRQGVRELFGGYLQDVAQGLCLPSCVILRTVAKGVRAHV